MRQVEFKPLGRSVSQIGFGCARLDGRAGLRQATRLLETALDLGITYFDVAASYGMAEEAVGQVLGNVPDIVIATKVGPPRPPYNEKKMRLKANLRPILDRARILKLLLRGSFKPPSRSSSPRGRKGGGAKSVSISRENCLTRTTRGSLSPPPSMS